MLRRHLTVQVDIYITRWSKSEPKIDLGDGQGVSNHGDSEVHPYQTSVSILKPFNIILS